MIFSEIPVIGQTAPWFLSGSIIYKLLLIRVVRRRMPRYIYDASRRILARQLRSHQVIASW